MSAAQTAVIGARLPSGPTCDDCGSLDVMSISPGSDPVIACGFVVSRGTRSQAWCRACWFKQFGPKKPTIMDWITAMAPPSA